MDDALTDAALDRELEAAVAVDPSPELVARVRMRVQRERDASWSPLRFGVAAAAAAIVVVVAVAVGMSRANRSQIAQDRPVPVAQNSTSVPVAQDLNPFAVAQPPSQGFGEPRRSSPDQSTSGGGDFSPAPQRNPPVAQDFSPAPQQNPPVAQDFSPAPSTSPRKAVGPSARRGAPRNQPEVIIAADEARALRRLFADVRKGIVDLSSWQEGAPVTAALQPPSEIAFPPITFESIAPETVEEGERQ